MSPQRTFFLVLMAVFLAGAPLPWLTRDAAPQQVDTPVQAAKEAVYATLRCTGNPTKLVVLHEGKILLSIEHPEPVWEGEWQLPAEGALYLEVQADWQQEGAQAVTIELEPQGRELRSCTRWSFGIPGAWSDSFSFVW